MKNVCNFTNEIANEILAPHNGTDKFENTIEWVCRQWGVQLNAKQTNALHNVWAKFHDGILPLSSALRMCQKAI